MIQIENLLEYDIICSSETEFIDCAKFLLKRGFKVVNFANDKFKNNDKIWCGMSYDHLERTWGRFYTQKFYGHYYVEFKYLIRKDKLLKINEI
jgi:very-short-patch-repair endonuclease